MLIALGVTVVVALLWFVMLRPKAEAPTTPASPSQAGTELTDRPNEAQSAVNDANSANSANEQKAENTGEDKATSTTGSQSQNGAESTAKSDTKKTQEPTGKVQAPAKSTDPSAAIIASAQKGNTEVILFWDPAGSDDQHVRQAIKQLDLRNGTVKVHAIHIMDVGKYTALTRDVTINTSPTLVVLSSDLKAWRITGYTDTYEINGLVGAVARTAG